MTTSWNLSAIAAGVLLLAACPVFAQSSYSSNFPISSSSGSSTNSGLFGSRSVGSSVNAGSRTTTGANASGGLGNQEAAGQLDGSERYMRGNRQGAFVGADSADASALGQQQAGRNQMQQNQMQQLLGMNRNQQSQMLNQQMQQNGAGKNNREIRAVLQVDFDRPVLLPARVAEQAQKIIVRAKPLQGLGTIQVGVEGRVAVLTGTVHSERARKLAEQLVLLEPGISDVRNDLKVSPPAVPSSR